AREMGLVNKVLPVADLLPFARAQAAKLVALPASSIRTAKRLMKDHHTATVEDKITEESKYFSEMLASPEAQEAFTAFFQKRKPDFTKFS
ncbi:MAG: enoyl-CoA hydratase-related protein, partial [Burkholderiales bacterium]